MIKPIMPKFIINKYESKINFCGLKKLDKDTFESEMQNVDLKLYNPYTMKNYSQNIQINLNEPQIIVLDKCNLTLDYDPKRIDYITDKIQNKKIKVNIIKSEKPNKAVFYFMSPDLKKEYGYTYLSKVQNKNIYEHSYIFEELLEDYPEVGITGPRVIVEYTQNWNDKKFGGIGKLADKMAVKYCLDNDIDFNIISLADKGSHIAHFKRGKRFLPLDSYERKLYSNLYGSYDLNKILEQLLFEAEKNESTVNIGNWGMKAIYMPKNIAQKYLSEIENIQ